MKNLRRTFARVLTRLIALNVSRVPAAAQDGTPAYDIAIRNGRVIDGAGNP